MTRWQIAQPPARTSRKSHSARERWGELALNLCFRRSHCYAFSPFSLPLILLLSAFFPPRRSSPLSSLSLLSDLLLSFDLTPSCQSCYLVQTCIEAASTPL